MDIARDPWGGSGAGADPASVILDRLDSIGRLLARGAPPHTDGPAPRPEVEAHLVTRIDMLGRIVEQVLADREEADACLAALTGRLVDLEGTLAPALLACEARLAEAVPLLAEASLDRLPGGGAALRLALRDLRDTVAALDRRLAPAGHAPLGTLPPAAPGHPPAPGGPTAPHPGPPEGRRDGPEPVAPDQGPLVGPGDAGLATADAARTGPAAAARLDRPGPGSLAAGIDGPDGDESLRRLLATTWEAG